MRTAGAIIDLKYAPSEWSQMPRYLYINYQLLCTDYYSFIKY